MTLTEKILARASGKAQVQAGDNVWVKADVLMTHDVCGPGTIGVFKREFGKGVHFSGRGVARMGGRREGSPQRYRHERWPQGGHHGERYFHGEVPVCLAS